MNTDSAILLMLADRQREIEVLRAENAELRARAEAVEHRVQEPNS